MRHKLLIIDDEPFILNWIAELFMLQNKYEIDVFRANNVQSALQILDRHWVDLIVSDIKMPGMSGMELLDIVLEKWPRCKLIFLTAYEDFDYIYSAMQKGAVAFCLKTEDDDRILNAVYNAIEVIEKERKSEGLLREADQKLKTIQPTMQNMVLKNILYDFGQDEMGLQADFETAGIKLRVHSPFFALLIRAEHKERRDIHARLADMMYVDSILYSHLPKEYYAVSFVAEDSNGIQNEYYLCSLIQPVHLEKSGESRVYYYLSQMLEDIQRTVMTVLDCSVSCCLSSKMTTMNELKARYRLLRMILDIHGDEGAVILTDTQPEAVSADEILENDEGSVDLNLLKQSILSGNSVQSLRLMEQFLEAPYLSQQQIYSYYSDAKILLTVLQKKYQISSRFSEPLISEELCDAQKAMTELKEEIRSVCQEIKGLNERTEKNIVSRVKGYVKEHLAGELSLDIMADELHYNPSYLSRLFHQLTGITVSQYITRVRIDKAKEMLENKDTKIKDICKAIGFDSPSYFSRFFKKETGYTPQKYRDKDCR